MAGNATLPKFYQDLLVQVGVSTDAQMLLIAVGSATYTIVVTGTPTGGTYTLLVGDEETDTIAHNAVAAAIETAIEGNANVPTGEGTTTGTSPITTVFSGTLVATELVLALGTNSLTGGSDPTVVVTQIVDGTDTILGLWDNIETQLATQFSGDTNAQERAQTAFEEKLLDLGNTLAGEIS